MPLLVYEASLWDIAALPNLVHIMGKTAEEEARRGDTGLVNETPFKERAAFGTGQPPNQNCSRCWRWSSEASLGQIKGTAYA